MLCLHTCAYVYGMSVLVMKHNVVKMCTSIYKSSTVVFRKLKQRTKYTSMIITQLVVNIFP